MLNKSGKIVFVFAVVVFLISCGAKEEKAKPVEQFAVKLETLPAMTVATLNRTGPYSEVKQAMTDLMTWLEANKVTPAGQPFTLYYDSPADVSPESCSWAVCVPVPPETKGDEKSGIDINALGPITVAFTIHTGGLEKISETYDKLTNWIDEQDLVIAGPAVEFYLSGGEVPSESIKVKAGFVVQPVPDEEGDKEETGGS
ncbi:MAG: GyrI-like domain-containing protein [candidate division WOR-3 bacterium]